MIQRQLELIHELEDLPISVYDEQGKCLHMYPDIPSVRNYNLVDLQGWSEFYDYTQQVTCLSTSTLLFLGFIPDEKNKHLIILGPVSSVPLDSEALRQITEYLTENYAEDLAKTISGMISCMKLMDMEHFQKIIRLIDSLVNNEIHKIRTFQSPSINETQAKAIKKMTSAINAEVTFDDHDYTDTDIQDRILFYISNGMVEDLEQIKIPDFIMDIMNRADLRHTKNSLIVLNSLSQRADIEALNQLSARMFIPSAYARLVRDVNVPGNTSRDIRTVIIYVQNHFREQITVRFLADLVNLSEAHLSRKFKAETGITLKDFISREKIHEAEALLRFTDLSLAAISEALSFSSQSWYASQIFLLLLYQKHCPSLLKAGSRLPSRNTLDRHQWIIDVASYLFLLVQQYKTVPMMMACPRMDHHKSLLTS